MNCLFHLMILNLVQVRKLLLNVQAWLLMTQILVMKLGMSNLVVYYIIIHLVII